VIHTLKKGNITLSNWIEDSRRNWMKHRLFDYSEPIDVIRIIKEYRGRGLAWGIYFDGANLQYIQFLYNKLFANQIDEKNLPVEDQLELIKKNIDTVLSKADKLIIFA
jgi:acetylornithine/succinyldiaminopimelate/putrescine aminotransferase